MARLLRAARLPASWPSGVDLRALCSSSGSSRPGPSQMELPSMAQRAREKTEEVLRQLSLDRVLNPVRSAPSAEKAEGSETSQQHTDHHHSENSDQVSAKADGDAAPDNTSQKSGQKEHGGPKGPEPTRFGDWERAGRCSDF